MDGIVMGSPLAFGVWAFAASCGVAGLNMLGVGAQPMDKVGGACSSIYKWAGVSLLLLGVPLILITNGAGPLSAWVAVIWGMFGIIFFAFGECVTKGQDFRPVGYFTFFTGIMCAVGVYIATQIGSWQFAIGLTFATLTCFSCVAAMHMKPLGFKLGGIFFMCVAVWWTYVGVTLLWPLPPA